MCQFTSLLTEHFDLNKDDGHIRLLIMNNKSSCQRRRILPSVHSTDAVPYFSNHQVLFRTCPSRTSNLAKNHSYKEWENYIIVTDPVAQHTVQKLWDYSCSVLRYLSVTIVTLYPVRHDRYMIVKVHSYVKVILLIPSTVLWI